MDTLTRHDLGREAFVDRVWQWKARGGRGGGTRPRRHGRRRSRAQAAGKDLAAVRKDAEQSSAKLANASFTEKAPADVVEKTRQRLSAAEADITRLESRLASLT